MENSDNTKPKTKSKSPKKCNSKDNKKYNLRERKNTKNSTQKQNYKIIEDSEDDNDSDWTPGDVYDDEDESESQENVVTDYHSDSHNLKKSHLPKGKKDNMDMDSRQLQKFIQKIFPSKAGKERLKQLEKIDKMITKNDKKSNSKKGVTKKNPKSNKKNKTKVKPTQDTESESEDENDSDLYETVSDSGSEMDDDDSYSQYDIYDEGEEDEDELLDEHEEELLKNNTKFNIVFTLDGDNEVFNQDSIYGGEMDESDEEEYLEKIQEYEEERGKKIKKLVKGAAVNVRLPEWDKEYRGTITGKTKRGTYNINLDIDKDNGEEFEELKKVKLEYITLVPEEIINEEVIMDELKELIKKRRKGGKKSMEEHFDKICKIQEKFDGEQKAKKEKKEKTANVSKLRKLLRDKNVMNDFKYFKNMSLADQNKILLELEEVNKFTNVEKPYRLTLLESEIPVPFKAKALRKINMLNFMDPGSGEYYKTKQWVDTFMRIPFGVHRSLPLRLNDGQEKCNEFMETAKKTLDDAVYGLDDAKMQIMQLIGQWISNPNSVGTAIAVKGPPGTGKTTLIKDGISKILNRPFSFIALGGATDSSFLEGHSYTYEGSTWGKIVDILINSKCMNPVFYFDELDKISDTPKGEEITGILTHLTDTTQNQLFHDKYFSSIDFNISKALFIFSYNDESKINPILKDRMYRIHTAGYDSKQKIIIAKQHLIPKIQQNINFGNEEIVIPDETISHICSNFTEGEKGVRNLKRCLEIIYTKLNLYRLMKPDSNLFDKEKSIKVEFPFTVTSEIVEKLIKKNDTNGPPPGMYV